MFQSLPMLASRGLFSGTILTVQIGSKIVIRRGPGMSQDLLGMGPGRSPGATGGVSDPNWVRCHSLDSLRVAERQKGKNKEKKNGPLREDILGPIWAPPGPTPGGQIPNLVDTEEQRRLRLVRVIFWWGHEICVCFVFFGGEGRESGSENKRY